MEEILKKLVESELLTEETRDEVLASLHEAVEKMAEEKATAIADVRKAELEEQFKADFVSERDSLIESVDNFLANNLREGITSEIREEMKAEFIQERAKLIESVSDFLDLHLADAISEGSVSKSHGDSVAEAFLEHAKALLLSEQDVPAEAEKIITKLQKSLEEKEARINELYSKVVESKKTADKVVLESKVEDFIRMIPEDKKSIARRLMEGVELEKFDSYAKNIRKELLKESDNSDEIKSNGTQASKEVIVEAQPKSEEDLDIIERAQRRLSGIK